jgi:hypothetical protein
MLITLDVMQMKGGSIEKLIIGIHMADSPHDQKGECDPPALRTIRIRPSICPAT